MDAALAVPAGRGLGGAAGADARPPARLYLPGNECLCAASTGGEVIGTVAAGRATGRGRPASPTPSRRRRRRPPPPRAAAAPPRPTPAPGHADHRPVYALVPIDGGTTIPPNVLDPTRAAAVDAAARRTTAVTRRADRRPARAAAPRHDRSTSSPTGVATLPERAAADGRRRPSSPRDRRADADSTPRQRRSSTLAIEAARARRRRADAAARRAWRRQLKTVIAPREAEALMHELDTLAAPARRRSTTRSWRSSRSSRRSSTTSPAATRRRRRSRPRADAGAGGRAGRPRGGDRRASWRARRRARPTSPPASTDACSPLRAAARPLRRRRRRPLDGSRCGGCHLDLSTAELDERAGRRRRASSPTARSAGGCSSPDGAGAVFLWFIGTAVAHRLVRVPRPALRLPAADRRLGPAASSTRCSAGRGVLHTLVFSVRPARRRDAGRPSGRKPVRKLLLGLPIGTLLHLVFDGAWTTPTCSGGRSAGWSFGGRAAAGGGARLVERPARADRAGDPRVGLAPCAARRPGAPARAFCAPTAGCSSTRRAVALWMTLDGVLILVRHGRTALNADRPAAGPHRRAARRGRPRAGDRRWPSASVPSTS